MVDGVQNQSSTSAADARRGHRRRSPREPSIARAIARARRKKYALQRARRSRAPSRARRRRWARSPLGATQRDAARDDVWTVQWEIEFSGGHARGRGGGWIRVRRGCERLHRVVREVSASGATGDARRGLVGLGWRIEDRRCARAGRRWARGWT